MKKLKNFVTIRDTEVLDPFLENQGLRHIFEKFKKLILCCIFKI